MKNKGVLSLLLVCIVTGCICHETGTAYSSTQIDQSSAGDNSPVVNAAGNVTINILPPGNIKEDTNKLRMGTYRVTPDGEGALTPEMIEECIYLNMDVDAKYSVIVKTKEQFDVLNKELTEIGERLKAAKNEVDRSGCTARSAYDAKVMNYNSRLPELDHLLDLYKQRVKAYQDKSDRFDRECNGQPYYEDDYAAMVKKVGRGM
ncbi:MAG: hypothetical protein CDV28_14620 [Candidatus Electronema aureum]|uniref:Lipoprotein n=1 Tax=Candidatus Electronema aureum TaxID=2005002 RepID=A0A521FYX9_9BACT|nr:MAG: hypothetical protein CDV28_14620 [Candidatus Electronema aureum]